MNNSKEKELKKKAKDLLNEPKEKIVDYVKGRFDKSFEEGIKFATTLISVIKEDNKDLSNDYENFCDVCDSAIKAMSKTINDKVLSSEEIKMIIEKIDRIIEIADKARQDRLNQSRETTNKVLDTVKDVTKMTIITTSALAAIKIVLKIFIKKGK